MRYWQPHRPVAVAVSPQQLAFADGAQQLCWVAWEQQLAAADPVGLSRPTVSHRRIVGWSIDSKQDSTLVVNALDMAIRDRRPAPGGIVHADHGTQFT